ncbi:hypothetical protein GO491_02590 [Flavobacteriaceae bacterium Ap0902]|nr:hypothetical protein [Flavobacteriaceae bacterium Ap0902]
MKKNIAILFISLLNVIAFAQAGGEGDGTGGDVGGNFVPIDNYVYALIAVAVLIIAYAVYKQRQKITA